MSSKAWHQLGSGFVEVAPACSNAQALPVSGIKHPDLPSSRLIALRIGWLASMSDFTRALRADGFPPENESFVRSLEGLEGAVRHPLYTRESDHSSDDEYTEDEASGALVLLSRREARRRINARNRQSTGQPQPQPKDIPGKSAKVYTRTSFALR